jgi:hypothetical protein
LTNFVLLLGAGFSRNWGGWLASEAFEYLLGCPEIDESLKVLLWRHKRGGFEAALAELQKNRVNKTSLDPRLANLQNAILRMFADMDKAFDNIGFEFQSNRQYQIAPFLTRFHAIFTLNQDLLLERHYLNDNVTLLSDSRWNGWVFPGMKRAAAPASPLDNPNLGKWEPDPENFVVRPCFQPYFKLHGSSNWVASNSDELLVLGHNKRSIIDRYPVLKWSREQFKETLSRPSTRLMVIGYSFGDNHINEMIREAATNQSTALFVIDPLGVDVIDKNRNAQIWAPDELAEALWPHVIGSSRRSLREIFGTDRVEHGKVMRFFT